jgi:hypothetical protein
VEPIKTTEGKVWPLQQYISCTVILMSSDLAVHAEAPYKILTDEVVGRHMVAARHIQVIKIFFA